jgi:hypothetical protein
MSEDQAKSLTTVTQALTGQEFKGTINDLARFVKTQLKEAKNIKDGDTGDYGIIPFTKKKTLLKPGAEKLLKLFGLVPNYEKISEVEDWEKGFVFYKYRCILTHYATGKFAGDAIRSANSKEKQVALTGKPVYEVANTVEAKAQKRALVAATVQATMASEIFDADISGEYDAEAPNKSTTKEEDPARQGKMARLYGVASAHGWTDKWIHAAIKKKYSVESLTNISNSQIEELTEFIVTAYLEVAKGEKPKLREENKPVNVAENSANQPLKVTEEAKEEMKAELEKEPVEEGEVIEEPPLTYKCKGKIHEGKPESEIPDVPIGEFCSDACRDSYYPPKKDLSKYQFGKKNDQAGEAS